MWRLDALDGLFLMSELLPPTIDPVAAQRWHKGAPTLSPWLHEEVGKRMQERLQWITRAPQSWCHWHAVRGGLQAHEMVAQRYPKAMCYVVETAPRMQAAAQAHWARSWWSPANWSGGKTLVRMPEAGSVEMLWANMALHTQAEPLQMIQAWQRALTVDGFLMFSCLGPDTARELRQMYAAQGWPAAGHQFTDMHDWGDMLVQSGFAEPVMDMESITLTFETPERLLQELRGVGCNLHPQRFAALRGRGFLQQLHLALGKHMRLDGSEGQFALTFELVYGHAFKSQPRVAIGEESTVSLDTMRSMLRQGKQQGKR